MSTTSIPDLDRLMPPAPPLLRLDGVHMAFGKNEVLRDITLHIRKGETTVIIGESGCGKTVMLKLLIGLLRPSAGQATFDGRVLTDLPEADLVRQRLRFGFVFQGAALFDSLTVFDNIAFPLREHTNKSNDEIEVLVWEQIHEVGLPGALLQRRPAELSGGQRKRVGLARALILKPEVVLYDEPTTGLDPIMSDVINELIRQTHQRHHVTSVVVSHDMKTVAKVAQRIVMLNPVSRIRPNEQQIIFDGDAAELLIASDPRVQQFVRGEAQSRVDLSQSSLSDY
ncbi:MAG TPA: ATP-binding cassette domain-containing protein [Gemmatales bacterium]|nr:ATP-binding cassette domain-containing protein [Gemmatales bacterium]